MDFVADDIGVEISGWGLGGTMRIGDLLGDGVGE